MEHDTYTHIPAMYSLARSCALRATRSHLPTTLGSSSRSAAALSRLASTLAILEQREGSLNSASLGAVTAGTKIGGSVHGFIAGKNVKSIAEEAAKVEGLEKVISVDNEAYDRGLAENWAPLLVENIKKGGYTHVIVGHSAFGKNLLPRVAALLDVQQISDIMKVESEDSKSLYTNTTLYAYLVSPRVNTNYSSSIHPPNLRRQRHPNSPIHRPHQTPHSPPNRLPTRSLLRRLRHHRRRHRPQSTPTHHLGLGKPHQIRPARTRDRRESRLRRPRSEIQRRIRPSYASFGGCIGRSDWRESGSGG